MTKPDMLAELAKVVRELDRAFSDENEDSDGSDQLWANSRAGHFLRTHHAELEAMARDCQGEREVVWEIWQDDMIVANSDSLQDAEHYMMIYSQDGPVELKRVVAYRKTIDDAMREENSHD